MNGLGMENSIIILLPLAIKNYIDRESSVKSGSARIIFIFSLRLNCWLILLPLASWNGKGKEGHFISLSFLHGLYLY